MVLLSIKASFSVSEINKIILSLSFTRFQLNQCKQKKKSFKRKMGWKHFVIISLFFTSSTVYSKSHKYWDRDLTVLLAEGAEDCYFLPNIKATNEVDIEYQVSENCKIVRLIKIFIKCIQIFGQTNILFFLLFNVYLEPLKK